MSRMPPFNSPLLLGFENFERLLDQVAKSSCDTYPPYNIEQIDENRLRITLAVAGFSMDDLSVSIEDSQLIVRGLHQDDGEERIYLHRGIAGRQFQRGFVLAEGIEVIDATLDNGLLHIDVERPVTEPDIRAIKIKLAENAASKVQTKTIEIPVND